MFGSHKSKSLISSKFWPSVCSNYKQLILGPVKEDKAVVLREWKRSNDDLDISKNWTLKLILLDGLLA